MFQYDYEKPEREWRRHPNAGGAARIWPNGSESSRSTPVSDLGSISNHSRRALPLPPRPAVICTRVHTSKPTVPLKVWVIASASCFAVCAALVLATVVITKWGTTDFAPQTHYFEEQTAEEPFFHTKSKKQRPTKTTTDAPQEETENENDLQYPILEKLSIFKNMVAKNRLKDKKTDNLANKPQIHPIHDPTIEHIERKIEKKDKAVPEIPVFKPTLPDVYIKHDFHMPNFKNMHEDAKNYDYEYYNDENLYNDYIQSNSMTNYLIEKVQELQEWITKDSDFEVVNNASAKFGKNPGNQFGEVLKALNESLVEGNVTIIMNKLKDLYFGENFTSNHSPRKVILGNSTDLLTFGILSIDVMLLRNIQLMAWENQDATRTKMLKDPDVFAFNALFLEPNKVEAKQNEVYHTSTRENGIYSKRPTNRQDIDDFSIGKNLLENVLEIGMSTARAAIHLGRAYKNTKLMLNQFSNRDTVQSNIQNQISRNVDGNTHALAHLENSFRNETNHGNYTELDCIWLLYCKNLVATSKLAAPYGVMARINGMALRMLTGELSADKALDTMLYEAFSGWTELRCNDMFPRCSKANAANIVLEAILQPVKKTQTNQST